MGLGILGIKQEQSGQLGLIRQEQSGHLRLIRQEQSGHLRFIRQEQSEHLKLIRQEQRWDLGSDRSKMVTRLIRQEKDIWDQTERKVENWD